MDVTATKGVRVKTRLAILCRRLVWILAGVGVLNAGPLSGVDQAAQKAGQKAVEETRQALRQQGFKTDLSDFDFSTSPELRAREAILKAADPPSVSTPTPMSRYPDRRIPAAGNRAAVSTPFVNHPNLLEPVGSDSAIVVWKLDQPKMDLPAWLDHRKGMSWQEFRDAVNTNRAQLDAACAAILSGPIHFNLDARRGGAMMLPHLEMLKHLAQVFGSRTVLDLHDGNLNGAWTNLMAGTRLVTAWEPEPVEFSHLARFANTSLAFNSLWQALQTNGWQDKQLAQLQTEWESADFFLKLPETAAFERAGDVAYCEHYVQNYLDARAKLTFGEFVKDWMRYPLWAAGGLYERWRCDNYVQHGRYEEETNLLLFHRDRELELRNAAQALAWIAIRKRLTVTNFPESKAYLPVGRWRNRDMSISSQTEGSGLLGSAAKAETQRRLAVAALALERYRAKHGAYPDQLSKLVPEFLKTPPIDFMDGQPLRYHPVEGGHFILYSVGLDCVDDGGRMPMPLRRPWLPGRRDLIHVTKGDILWPLPASAADVEALRAEEQAKQERRMGPREAAQADFQWSRSARHQADVEEILASPATNPPDLLYHRHHLSELLQNKTATGTNQLTLGEMLTLKQVITGGEPESVTFELPVSFKAVTSLGSLRLFIDTNNDDSDAGCNVQQMEFKRADNGNCWLVWSTIYESPGKHALQAELDLKDLPSDSPNICGSLLAFTITNLCEFSITSANYDPSTGATIYAKLPEKNGEYTVELNTSSGAPLKTITGSTSNGVIKVYWDLIDSRGQRFAGNEFDSVFHITLPDSGRSQTVKGP